MDRLLDLILNLGVACMSYKRKIIFSTICKISEKLPPQSKVEARSLITATPKKTHCFSIEEYSNAKSHALRFSHKSGSQLGGFLTLYHKWHKSKPPLYQEFPLLQFLSFLKIVHFDDFLVVIISNNSFWDASAEVGKMGECESRTFITCVCV